MTINSLKTRLLVPSLSRLSTRQLIYLHIGRVGLRLTRPFLQWPWNTWLSQEPADLPSISFPKVALSFNIQDQPSILTLLSNFYVLRSGNVPSVQHILMGWMIRNWIQKTICRYKSDTAWNTTLDSSHYLPPLQSGFLIWTQTAGSAGNWLVSRSPHPQVLDKSDVPNLIPTPKVLGLGSGDTPDCQGWGESVNLPLCYKEIVGSWQCKTFKNSRFWKIISGLAGQKWVLQKNFSQKALWILSCHLLSNSCLLLWRLPKAVIYLTWVLCSLFLLSTLLTSSNIYLQAHRYEDFWGYRMGWDVVWETWAFEKRFIKYLNIILYIFYLLECCIDPLCSCTIFTAPTSA